MASILTNTGAMVALQTLRGVNDNLATTQSQISTGKSVATAKDNAATWAISKVMESDVQGFRGIKESLSLGQSTISVARTASETITDLLTDIKGKIVAAQEANVDREKIQTDIAALRNQIESVVNASQFNGVNLINNDDMLEVLSSLDRSDAGVNASRISVSGQALSTAEAVAGTEASAELTATATASGLDNGNVQAAASQAFTLGGDAPAGTDQDVTFTLAGNAPAGGGATQQSFAVNGVTINVEFADNADDEAMATAIRAAFDAEAATNTALDGITVGGAGAAVEFTSSGLTSTVDVDFSAINALGTVTAETAGNEDAVTLGASAVETTAQVTVNGVELDVTFGNGANAEAMATAIEEAIAASDDPALEGITVARDGAELTFTNASGGEVAVNLGAVDGLAAATVTGTGVTDGAATIADNSARVAFASDDMELRGGDTFTVTLGEESFSYTLNFNAADTTAGRAAAFAEIAEGLAEAINASEGFSATVGEDGQLVIGNLGGDPVEFGIEAFTGGESGGRLNALAGIDVSTSEGARDALTEIEGLIQTAIDASAAFGSAQARIDNQMSFVDSLTDSLRAGIGTLVDADMEEASARLQALQVQQQLAIQSLSIANQAPQNILSLFR